LNQEALLHLETIAVHAAADPDEVTGSVAPPIHLSTTFEHGPACEHIHGYSYIREANPTQTRLESALADLEGGEAALAFASGMGAGSAVLQTLAPGSHVIMPDDIYVDLRNLAKEFFFKWQLEHTVVDMSQIEQVRAALRTNTQLIWIETPSNPLMKVSDISAIAELAHGVRAKVIVDNTFATPILQRPLQLGADIVLHSTTKYFGGHSDVQGGALIFAKKDEHSALIENNRRLLGAAASPFNSWLVLRGIRSLACRMRTHSANAMAVAEALSQNSAVEAVHYPGLLSHPGHEVAKQQMSDFGGMLSIRIRGGRARAIQAASRVKLFMNATSLGGVESLIEHRASSEGKGSKTPEDLLRLSIGLEHPDDLIEDLQRALQ
jgi:cystathionine gamma-synthase